MDAAPPASFPTERSASPRQRAEGRVRIGVGVLGGRTRALQIAEAGSLRVRLPRGSGPAIEAVTINTGGGIACGDHFAVEAVAEPGASLVLTTTAAEKIYRSDGPVAHVDVRLTAAAGASIDWLPQETILFDRAAIRRSIEADLAPDARLLLVEAIVFGRSARGEVVRQGRIEDHWRIRRGGRLVYADSLRLDGSVSDRLDRPAIASGARAMANLLYVAPDAETRIEEARALLAEARLEWGASAWNGLLALRVLAPEGGSLRWDIAHFLEAFRGCPLPRVWQS